MPQFSTQRVADLAEAAEIEMTDRLVIGRGDGPARVVPIDSLMSALEGAGIGGEAAAIAVEAAEAAAEDRAATDIGVALAQGYAQDAAGVSGINVPLYASPGSAAGAVIAAGIQSLQTLTVGGVTPAPWNKVGAEPAHPGKFQSADGAWWELAATEINPRLFGASGDGAADDTAAIAAALQTLAALGGGTLTLDPGTYRITAPLQQVFADGVKVTIQGRGAKIDATEIVGGDPGSVHILRLGGARVSQSALGTNAVKHENELIAAGAPWAAGLEMGEVLLVTSTDLFNPTRGNYVKGEMVSVLSAAGAVLTLGERLFDAYAAATTTLHRLAMPIIEVHGLEIQGDANHIGLSLNYVRNAVVQHCTVHGTRYCGINLDFIFGASVDKCQVYDVWYPGTGTSYGVTIGMCQQASVTNCNLREARHCLTTGGAEPARCVTYAGNHCLAKPDQGGLIAIDAHENVEFLNIVGNTCNGITSGAVNVNITGNTIFGYSAVGGGINTFFTYDAGYLNISDNIITIAGPGAFGIHLTFVRNIAGSPPTLTLDTLSIKDNQVRSPGSCILIEPRNAGSTNVKVRALSISDNALYSEAGVALVLSGSSVPMAFDTIDISDNRIVAAAQDAIYMLETATAEVTLVQNNIIRANRNLGYLAVLAGTDVVLTGNDIRGNAGGAGDARSILYANTGVVTARDNTILNTVFAAEISDAAAFYSSNNRCSTYGLLNPAGAQLLGAITESGNNIVQRAAAPSTGTWKRGDRIYYAEPSPAGFIGEVCAVAGTPGTWTTFSEISS